MLSVVSLKYRDARQQQDQSGALQSLPCRNGTMGTSAPLLFVPFPVAENVSGPADLRLTTGGYQRPSFPPCLTGFDL